MSVPVLRHLSLVVQPHYRVGLIWPPLFAATCHSYSYSRWLKTLLTPSESKVHPRRNAPACKCPICCPTVLPLISLWPFAVVVQMLSNAEATANVEDRAVAAQVICYALQVLWLKTAIETFRVTHESYITQTFLSNFTKTVFTAA